MTEMQDSLLGSRADDSFGIPNRVLKLSIGAYTFQAFAQFWLVMYWFPWCDDESTKGLCDAEEPFTNQTDVANANWNAAGFLMGFGQASLCIAFSASLLLSSQCKAVQKVEEHVQELRSSHNKCRIDISNIFVRLLWISVPLSFFLPPIWAFCGWKHGRDLLYARKNETNLLMGFSMPIPDGYVVWIALGPMSYSNVIVMLSTLMKTWSLGLDAIRRTKNEVESLMTNAALDTAAPWVEGLDKCAHLAKLSRDYWSSGVGSLWLIIIFQCCALAMHAAGHIIIHGWNLYDIFRFASASASAIGVLVFLASLTAKMREVPTKLKQENMLGNMKAAGQSEDAFIKAWQYQQLVLTELHRDKSGFSVRLGIFGHAVPGIDGRFIQKTVLSLATHGITLISVLSMMTSITKKLG